MSESDIPTLLIIIAILAVIPGYIGWRRGYSFFAGWVCSFLVSPLIAIPLFLFARRRQDVLDKRRMEKRSEIKCPSCQEFISAKAVVCPYCRRDINTASAETPESHELDFSNVIAAKRSQQVYERTVRWNRYHALFWIGIIVVGIVSMIAFNISGSSDLRVEVGGLDQMTIVLQNVGRSPITILEITANDRKDCAFRKTIANNNPSQFNVKLQVGDAQSWFSAYCHIVRAVIKTDQGIYSYSF